MKLFHHRKWWVSFSLITGPVAVFLLTPISCGVNANQFTVNVTDVHDGDTFKGNDGVSYRLFGVDTPEISDQYHSWKPTTGLEQYYAVVARDFLSARINGQEVLCFRAATDQYNREIVKVESHHEDVGIALIRAGLARVAYIDTNPKSHYFTTDTAYYNSLLWAQQAAYNAHLEIWSHPQNEITSIFTKAI